MTEQFYYNVQTFFIRKIKKNILCFIINSIDFHYQLKSFSSQVLFDIEIFFAYFYCLLNDMIVTNVCSQFSCSSASSSGDWFIRLTHQTTLQPLIIDWIIIFIMEFWCQHHWAKWATTSLSAFRICLFYSKFYSSHTVSVPAPYFVSIMNLEE